MIFNFSGESLIPCLLPSVLGLIGVLAVFIKNFKIIKLALTSFVVVTAAWIAWDTLYQFLYEGRLSNTYYIA